MTDPIFTLEALENLLTESRDWPQHAQPGAFAAAITLLTRVVEHVDLLKPDGHLNLAEKLGSAEWHISAMFGFDVDNGHDSKKHLVWALGDLQTAKDLLERMKEAD